ncbi:MAG TPA: GNAT family N-acetyltransferase, partial [Actinomycetes bacterium]|nr:GNAT family N-acetyltransferase [Actinomycetes bacterium]
RQAQRLAAEIWGSAVDSPPITAELGRAIGHAGGYLSGAWQADPASTGPGRLIGVCVGFLGRDHSLHSHLCGVEAAARGRQVGHALKLHQRAWALRAGLAEITWTFDPLVRRNAFINLAKLGAIAMQYLPDFYGVMADQLNAGDEHSDRLLVSWPLADPRVARACAGAPAEVDLDALHGRGASVALDAGQDGRPQEAQQPPQPPSPQQPPAGGPGPVRLVRVPADIAAVRAADPAAGRAWRAATRRLLGEHLDGGGRIAGFHRDGWYVLDREEVGT